MKCLSWQSLLPALEPQSRYFHHHPEVCRDGLFRFAQPNRPPAPQTAQVEQELGWRLTCNHVDAPDARVRTITQIDAIMDRNEQRARNPDADSSG